MLWMKHMGHYPVLEQPVEFRSSGRRDRCGAAGTGASYDRMNPAFGVRLEQLCVHPPRTTTKPYAVETDLESVMGNPEVRLGCNLSEDWSCQRPKRLPIQLHLDA